MEAITREEKIMSGENLTPITREEMFLAKAAGMDVEVPQPITRKEIFLSKIGGSGGGASAVISPLEITENGTYTAGDGVDGYSPITVNVAGSGGDESLKYIEAQHEFVDLPNATSIKKSAFYNDTVLTHISMPNVTRIDGYAFQNDKNLALTSLPEGLTNIGEYAFSGCRAITITSIPAGVMGIGGGAFYDCPKLTTLTFKGTPLSIPNNAFISCNNLTTINVPWAEGAVRNAPWGATNATINYNYTGE